jgi:hypothetical protein
MPRTSAQADVGAGARMRVTTVRFGRDLWQLLESEAALAGTSTSQYIREASLARAAAAAAARGEDPFESLAAAGEGVPAPDGAAPARAEVKEARKARAGAVDAREAAQALRAESGQARAEARRRVEDAGRRSPSRRDRDPGHD